MQLPPCHPSDNPGPDVPQSPPYLLMTRPDGASRDFVDGLRRSSGTGFRPILAPLLHVTFANALPQHDADTVLVFTSAQGVRSYVALGGPELSGPGGRRAYCVGAATAAAAREAGLDAVSAEGDAGALVALIRDRAEGAPLLHLRGRHSRGDVAARLAAHGFTVRDAVVYDQQLQDLTPEARAALDGRVPVVAPLFSPRTACQFSAQARGRAPLLVAAMSPAVAAEVDLSGPCDLHVATAPNAQSMTSLVTRLLKDAAMLETRGGAQ